MPAITEWAAIAFLSTSAGQPNVAWSTLLEKLQEAIPISWFWVIFPLGVGAFLFILDVGDKLSGILGWLGIESPLRRGAQPESDWQRYRRILLNRVKRDVDGQVEASFYERVKLDLDMEDQEQQVGKHKIELVPEDTLEVFSTSTESLLNRVFQVFNSQKISPLPLASTQKIVDVFDRGDIQGQLLILGEPGAGKTTELLYLAQDLLERALKNENSPIPVFLELTTWDEGKSIDEWIAEKLSKPKSGGGYGINKLIVDQWIQDDDIIPLLDGLDEIVSLKRQRKCIKAINNFLAKRSPHGLVVCCRRKEYESAQVQINSLKGAVSLKPLREDQIQYFFQCLNRLSIWAPRTIT